MKHHYTCTLPKKYLYTFLFNQRDSSIANVISKKDVVVHGFEALEKVERTMTSTNLYPTWKGLLWRTPSTYIHTTYVHMVASGGIKATFVVLDSSETFMWLWMASLMMA